MSLDRLFKEGHLKKIPPSGERAKKSLEVSGRYLSQAEQTISIGAYDLAVIAAYSSIFHAARAILFVDGVGERAHFAVCEYLRTKHKDFGEEMISAFDMYRKLRHSVAYGLDTQVKKEDAENIVEFSSDFLSRIKRYLKFEE